MYLIKNSKSCFRLNTHTHAHTYREVKLNFGGLYVYVYVYVWNRNTQQVLRSCWKQETKKGHKECEVESNWGVSRREIITYHFIVSSNDKAHKDRAGLECWLHKDADDVE